MESEANTMLNIFRKEIAEKLNTSITWVYSPVFKGDGNEEGTEEVTETHQLWEKNFSLRKGQKDYSCRLKRKWMTNNV